MKQTRLALLLLATSLATPAFAVSVTMLQFGTFETKAEADKYLGQMKEKFAESLGGLATNVREVVLPPDQLKVYRTQAGPVADRVAAQGICAKLKAAGAECFIVQTAMVKTPAQMTASVGNAKSEPLKLPPETAASPDSVLEKKPSLLAETQEAEVKEQEAEPSLTKNLSTLQDVPARDPNNAAALASLRAGASETAPAVAELPAHVEPASPATTDSMQQALDVAAAKEQSTAEHVSNTVVTVEEKHPTHSFWSRLNPFSDEEPAPSASLVKEQSANEEPPVAAVPSEPVEVAVPAAASVSPPAPPSAPVEPSSVTTEPSPVLVPQATPETVTLPAVVESTPVKAEEMAADTGERLPPPPPPLREEDREALLAMQRAPKVQPTPMPTGEIAPMAAFGDVEVEEAQRVPLTASSAPPSGAAHMARSTVWAQLGPFTDAQAALAYWDHYRQAHPDFPVLRVRVTAPYQAKLSKSEPKVWLRLGPMQNEGFIRTLCGDVKPVPGFYCGRVMDMGIATEAKRTIEGLKQSGGGQ